MGVNGKSIGAGNGEWEQVLDNDFVNKVHLANKAPISILGERNGSHFTHKNKTYFRSSAGHVYKPADPE